MDRSIRAAIRYAESLGIPTTDARDTLARSLALSLIALWNTEEAIDELVPGASAGVMARLSVLLREAEVRYLNVYGRRRAAGLLPLDIDVMRDALDRYEENIRVYGPSFEREIALCV